MKIKAADTPSVFEGLRLKKRLSSKIGISWKSLFIGLAVVNLIGVLLVGGVAHKYSNQVAFGLQKVWGVAVELLDYPEALLHYILAQPASAENLYIDIKHIDVQSLEYQRTRALNDSVKDFKYVPATIRVGPGAPVKIKMRLKGDREIHYDDFDKMSYRVRVKGDNTVLGMKTFSLQKSRARNHIHEWIFLDLMRKSDLAVPRYKFVRLSRNGKDLGIFALEEHYTKHLIEANQRRDGPIIRFDEDTSQDYKKAVIEPYRYKKWTQPENLPVTRKAVQLLEAFRREELAVSEVFHVDQLAAFLAITDLTNTHHGAMTKSLRFYYNPITSKLEPVPFDGHFTNSPKEDLARVFGYEVLIASGYGLAGKKEHWIHDLYGGWFRHLFNNPDTFDRKFVSKYMAELEKFTAPGYLENYFLSVDDELSHNLDLIYKELPLFDNAFSFGPGPFIFDKQDYYVRRDRIRSSMEEVAIRAHLISQNGRNVVIEVQSSDTRFPLEILSLSCGNQVIEPVSDTSVLFEQGNALLEPSVHQVRAEIPEAALENWQDSSCYTLNYRILGTSKLKSASVTPWPLYDPEVTKNDVVRSPGNLDLFDFIRVDEQGSRAIVEPGSHRITRNLVVPAPYVLTVQGGTKLVLDKDAMILSRAPVRLTGEASSPVVITSEDGTGQGLTVISAGAESYMENVEISGMTNPSQNGWVLTGMVNFYESPLKFKNVRIHDNHSEDALNIIRSEFDMEHLQLRNAASDALDVDFGVGKIRKAVFDASGNDAIDVSGTVIDLEDIRINGAGDKGLSAGEDSRMTGRQLVIADAEVAVASKDSSNIRIDGLEISAAKVGLTAYRKKPEFGPASIEISGLTYDETGILQLIETNSNLTLDDVLYAGDVEKIEDLMYGAIYGKKSQ